MVFGNPPGVTRNARRSANLSGLDGETVGIRDRQRRGYCCVRRAIRVCSDTTGRGRCIAASAGVERTGDDRPLYSFDDVGECAVLRSLRENRTDRRRPHIRHCCSRGHLNARTRLGTLLGARNNPRAYQQMVPPAPARVVAPGGPRVLVACVPWYVFTITTASGWAEEHVSFQGATRYASYIYSSVGLPVTIFALIDVWSTIVRVKPRTEIVPEWGALAGLAIANFILCNIAPVPTENRYMLPVLPSVVLFSAAGINKIAHRVGARLPIGVVHAGLALALIAAFCAQRFALPLQLRNGGYEALVRDAMDRVSNVPQVWLISSGSTGEGCLVAAVALQETRPNSYVLRGKTILAGGDWFWGTTQDRFDTPAKLAGLLDDMPITIVVIDDRIPPNQQRPYQDRLRKLVAGEGEQWELIGSYPQTEGGIVFPNSLHVYARRPVASLAIAAPAIGLDRLRALMIRKELR